MSGPARRVVPRLNTMTVELTSGATIALRTISPRPYLKLTRDSYNNPLWSASGTDQVDDDSGRLKRFNEKFGMASNDAWSAPDAVASSSSASAGLAGLVAGLARKAPVSKKDK
ncbi:hypothetical protein BC828DRAFT_383429 [Blastocladiella britannica]|nr:hypothetical protein BC828DRAFT_383429 [Blastocladiella britannica]